MKLTNINNYGQNKLAINKVGLRKPLWHNSDITSWHRRVYLVEQYTRTTPFPAPLALSQIWNEYNLQDVDISWLFSPKCCGQLKQTVDNGDWMSVT